MPSTPSSANRQQRSANGPSRYHCHDHHPGTEIGVRGRDQRIRTARPLSMLDRILPPPATDGGRIVARDGQPLWTGGSLPSDAFRSEIGLGLLVGKISGQFSLPAAAIAAGRWPLADEVRQPWDKVAAKTPLLRSASTIERVCLTVKNHEKVPPRLNVIQLEEARRVFAEQVDASLFLDEARPIGRENIVTPLVFEHRLLERARKADRHIVLPEGAEERLLRAASRLTDQKICRLTLLGDPVAIMKQAANLGLSLDGVTLIDPHTSELRERFAVHYAEPCAKKGVTLAEARERVEDVSYFGTMMVLEGSADGIVSGSVNTTVHTISSVSAPQS